MVECFSSSGCPDEEFDDIVIWIANIHLLNPIATRSRPASDLYTLLTQVLHGCFQVIHLEGKMRCAPKRQFIRGISWVRDLRAPFNLLTDQVNLKIVPGKPGSRKIKVLGAGNLLHSQHLRIEPARTLDILHKQGHMVSFANIHSTLLKIY